MERKVCAAFQCRLGPMRVGPQGTIQVFADVFKMLIKEIITIRHADMFLYNLAPYIVILASIMAFSCLPINKGMEVLDFNVGIFFLLAASSIGKHLYGTLGTYTHWPQAALESGAHFTFHENHNDSNNCICQHDTLLNYVRF